MKNRIEAFAASHEDFPAMLKKAQQYLVARGKVDWTDSPAAVPPLRRSDSLGEDGNRRTCVYGVCLCYVSGRLGQLRAMYMNRIIFPQEFIRTIFACVSVN